MTGFEQEPDAAVALFGDRIELARRFTADLAREGETRGLIGPLELPRLWSRHILNSALVAPAAACRRRRRRRQRRRTARSGARDRAPGRAISC